jgi:hypothetical protein
LGTNNVAQKFSGRRLKIGSPHIKKIGGFLINDANRENISAATARQNETFE